MKDMEFDFIKGDGKPIHVLLSSRRYDDPKTGEVEYEGIIKDITTRKETAELIQKRNRELSVINSIAVTTNYTMELDSLLKVTLGRVLSVLSLAKGGIFLIDRADKKMILGATVGLPHVEKGKSVELIFKDLLLRDYLFEGTPKLMPETSFPYFLACYDINDHLPLCLSCHLIISKGAPVGFFGFVLAT